MTTDPGTCEWPFPACDEPATALMTYSRGDGPAKENGATEKALCSSHFREVEIILLARGLTWYAEPMGISRKVVALRNRALIGELANRASSRWPM